MIKKLDLSLNIPHRGKTCLTFEYTTVEQRNWATKEVAKYTARYGLNNVLSIVERIYDER